MTAAVYFCCLVMLAHAQCRPGRPAHHTDAHMRRRRTHAEKTHTCAEALAIVQSISVACRSGCLVILAHAWYTNDTDGIIAWILSGPVFCGAGF